MGNQDRSDLLLLAGSLVVLFGAVLGGGTLYWAKSPLKSNRPNQSRFMQRTTTTASDVDARLWQDPFEAVDHHAGSEGAKHHQLKLLEKEFARQMSEHQKEARVLMVMVQGGPYAEDIETRLRHRFAVVSGLATAGYVPEETERLGYVEFDWEQIEASVLTKAYRSFTGTKLNDTVRVPYEWFEPNSLLSKSHDSNPSPLLVLWLADECFAKEPLKRLAKLIAFLTEQTPDEQKMGVDIVGPSLSATLQEMASDAVKLAPAISIPGPSMASAESEDPKATLEILKGVRIFSAQPTAMDLLLCETTPELKKAQFEDLSTAIESAGIKFQRVTSTDDMLLQAIVAELELRGVRVGTDPIALVSEWDSLYSRSMASTLIHVLERRRQGMEICNPTIPFRLMNDTELADQLELDRIETHAYMRGLDGRIPEQPNLAAQLTQALRQGAVGSAQAFKETLKVMERPEGRSQVDYVPRIASLLAEPKISLFADRTAGRGEIKAVGLLGTDVYDKLLLLRALRHRLPKAIFFTTDLDARLLQPEEFTFTRNLIVASSFDLRLNEKLQHGVPPFRGSYQTATYLATLAALNYAALEGYRLEPSAFTPRIFEIGRSRPIPLNSVPTPIPLSVHPELQEERLALYAKVWGRILLILFGGMVLLVSMGLTLSPRLNLAIRTIKARLKKSHWRHGQLWLQIYRRPVVGLLLIVPVGFAILLYFASYPRNPTGEPLALWDGVSMWPTEIARLGVGLLSVFMLSKALCKLAKSDVRVLNSQEPSGNALTSEVKAANALPQLNRPDALLPLNAETALPIVQRPLRLYEFRSECRRRLGRAALATLIFLGVGLIFMFAFGWPHRPHRGSFVVAADGIILFLFTLFPFLLLVFCTVDATYLCRLLIEALGREFLRTSPKREVPCMADLQGAARTAWHHVRVFAQITEPVMQMTMYSFVCFSLLLLSRTRYFDNWDMPPGLLLILVIIVFLLVYSAVRLRQSAENSRKMILDRLREFRLENTWFDLRRPNSVDPLGEYTKAIEGIRSGAFQPWRSHPLVQAMVLIPTSIAGVSMLDML